MEFSTRFGGGGRQEERGWWFGEGERGEERAEMDDGGERGVRE